MTAFSLFSPGGIDFGPGSIAKIPEIIQRARPKGSPVLVLTDKGFVATGVPRRAAASLEDAGFAVSMFGEVPPEPGDNDIDRILELKELSKIQAIVAIGGGSVIDTAKVLSVLARTDRMTESLLERVPADKGIPFIAVPTTAGTGAEATPNAIVRFSSRNLKIGIVSPYFLPEHVVLDPELILSLPPGLTASTGIDALCHLLESFLAKRANPFSDMYAKEGMRILQPALRRSFADGSDIEARSAAMLAAYYGGVCIASAGTNAIHALSYPLGSAYHIPHGIANATLLVPVIDFQKEIIAPRLASAAEALGFPRSGDDRFDAAALVKHLRDLVADLRIPASLSALNVPPGALGELSDAAFAVRRLLDNNPLQLSREDIQSIYESVR